MRRGIVAAVGALVLSAASPARAELPRDYFLDAPGAGTYSMSDVYNVGAQQSLENRLHLEEGMSMLTTRLSGIASYPYADGSLNVDVRLFLFTLGGSVGYRQVYRNHTFAPGEDSSRDVRNDRESDKEFDSQGFPHAEGRFRVVIPLDSFMLLSTTTLRWEDVRDNSFDWFHANMHDGGRLLKSEATLFFRHRDFGAIGPYGRVIDVPRTRADGTQHRETELHYGLVYGTRPGLVRPRGGNSDLVLVQLVFKFGPPGRRATPAAVVETAIARIKTQVPLAVRGERPKSSTTPSSPRWST
jgi:hypothetical protein